MAEELSEAASATTETMLVVAKKIISLYELDHIITENSLVYLNDMRCKSNRTVINC